MTEIDHLRHLVLQHELISGAISPRVSFRLEAAA